MNAKTKVVAPPLDHFDEWVIDQSFLFQHLQNICTKEFGTAANINIGHDIEIAAWHEQSVRHHGIEMWMERA